MTGRGKLPVDPLTDAAWHRIRGQVFAELAAPIQPAPRSTRELPAWRYMAAVAAIASLSTIIVLLVARFNADPWPQVTTSRLATAASPAQAILGDATLEAAANTELIATGSDAVGWTVVLERGRVLFSVPRRATRPSFRVQAGSVALEVTGTVFSVERSPDDVHVAVVDGAVRVTAVGEARELKSGQSWHSRPPALARASAAASTQARTPVASPSSSATPQPSAPRVNAAPPAERFENPALLRPRRERFEAALGVEKSSPERALTSYLELSRGTDTWAEQGLYSAARVELARGRSAAARALLQQYLARFPKAPNAQNVRRLLEKSK